MPQGGEYNETTPPSSKQLKVVTFLCDVLTLQYRTLRVHLQVNLGVMFAVS